MLLVFDEINFLDPVEDDEHRAKLYRNLETAEDRKFRKYRDLHQPLLELKSEGAIKYILPNQVVLTNKEEVTASAISDLIDKDWIEIAKNPQKYQMPHRKLGVNESPSWNIFEDKIPKEFISVIKSNTNFQQHLIYEGDSVYSWILSYEAGSAISTNYHLAVASKLGLAPCTDSLMHHDLLMKKFFRAEKYNGYLTKDEDITKSISQNIAITLIEKLLDSDHLSQVSFEEILKFRDKTKNIRHEFIREINEKISINLMGASESSLIEFNKEILLNTKKEIFEYQNEIKSIRNRLWPEFIGSLNHGLASTGMAAVAFNYLGGTEYLLGASIIGASLSLLKSSLSINNEFSKQKRKKSPIMNYLTRVQKNK